MKLQRRSEYSFPNRRRLLIEDQSTSAVPKPVVKEGSKQVLTRDEFPEPHALEAYNDVKTPTQHHGGISKRGLENNSRDEATSTASLQLQDLSMLIN